MHSLAFFGILGILAVFTAVFLWGCLKLTRELRGQSGQNLQFLQGTHQNYQVGRW